MPKSGTEYELFVKYVYECLNRTDGLTDVQIQHDVKIVGASGVAHQIDLFWTFKKGGVAYKVAVECKDYNKHVSKEKILTFHAVLQDIGNVHGIFASKVGFQSGAKDYALKYGMQLMEIRPPVDGDWDGRFKDIHIELRTLSIGNVLPQIFLNKAKAEEMGTIPSIKHLYHMFPDAVSIKYGKMTSEDMVIEEQGMTNVQELIRRLPQRGSCNGCTYRYDFEDSTICLDSQPYPIDSIVFEYDVRATVEHITIQGDNVIKAIVRNVNDGSEVNIDKFGRVNLREEI